MKKELTLDLIARPNADRWLAVAVIAFAALSTQGCSSEPVEDRSISGAAETAAAGTNCNASGDDELTEDSFAGSLGIRSDAPSVSHDAPTCQPQHDAPAPVVQDAPPAATPEGDAPSAPAPDDDSVPTVDTEDPGYLCTYLGLNCPAPAAPSDETPGG